MRWEEESTFHLSWTTQWKLNETREKERKELANISICGAYILYRERSCIHMLLLYSPANNQTFSRRVSRFIWHRAFHNPLSPIIFLYFFLYQHDIICVFPSTIWIFLPIFSNHRFGNVFFSHRHTQKRATHLTFLFLWLFLFLIFWYLVPIHFFLHHSNTLQRYINIHTL